MTDEEKEAIDWLKYLQETRKEQIRQQAWVGTNTFDAIDVILNLIEKQQVEIEKKDKIIDKMADMLVKDHEWFYSDFDNYTKEQFIDYFTKEVEGIKMKYNIVYKANGEIIEKKNLSREEAREFIDSLQVEDESELKVKRVDDEIER
jgi:phytoene/squalene synthetase